MILEIKKYIVNEKLIIKINIEVYNIFKIYISFKKSEFITNKYY